MTKEFCSDKCRRQFHANGSAFGKLRDTVTKMIERQSKEEAGKQFAAYVAGKQFRRQLAAAGFIHRSQIKDSNLPKRVEDLERMIAQLLLHRPL